MCYVIEETLERRKDLAVNPNLVLVISSRSGIVLGFDPSPVRNLGLGSGSRSYTPSRLQFQHRSQFQFAQSQARGLEADDSRKSTGLTDGQLPVNVFHRNIS
ncbi:hypothetical protein EVAR_78899_1 [Eumeta japonica]|uniref:Uncharacterized protein n=1 Tax=Eumeta variegata TaxID=151549 RepID=A0A4C1U2I5_EUMVA|nr:hypothetical protein EVAR_78899_1 [Eumeta japonica]